MIDKLGWHFVGETLRDGRPIPPDGELLRYDGPLVMCESGLHVSIRPINALEYAPGSTICRVRYGGEIIYDNDKLVCRERTILWRADATETLLAFSRWCALQVIHLWDAPPVVREYLETGDENIRKVAWAAALGDAVLAPAWDASRLAALAAARGATLAVAWDAAREAAWGAAWTAAWDTQDGELDRRLLALGPEGAV